ncbi:MAG: M6 family metalloprotease domain-containing protein [Muribaculaceae bacterium]|nr:M6 family metalloprotease domain-containing protein [Muribaculaceae bacterium]
MKSFSVFSITLALAGAAAMAMPPRQGLLDVTQPDGTVVKAELFGNGHWSAYIAPDGTLLEPDSDGRLVPAGISLADKKAKQTFLRAKALESDIRLKNTVSSYPTKGKIKTLVILAQFADIKFHSADPADAIGRMLTMPGYNDNGATGSVCDYFRDSSFGIFELEPVVMGPVTLPENMAYYGAPSNSSPDVRPEEMIRDACALVDDRIDFSEFDLDGDGFIDNVYVFYPGYSQADGAQINSIWPHSGFAWSKHRAEFDGVKLNKYACSNEIDMTTKKLVGIGTFCHEFTHVLGIPDLYSTDYSNNEHPGTWSIMATGGRNNNGHTPPLFSAYERYALGWVEPQPLEPSADDYTLEAGRNTAFIINTSDDNEFFILENRQRDGWDAFLPGHGMLVWHIDYDKTAWETNTVNNDASHQRIDLVEADGSSAETTRGGDAFPGNADISEIALIKPFNGPALNKGIFNIREFPGGTISFNVADIQTKLPAPREVTASDISPVSFHLSWDAVEGADTYVVEAYRKVRSGSVFNKEYVDGFRLYMTGGQCSATVTGLTPSTEYFYRVRAMGGTFVSDYSAEHQATTLDEDFRAEIPVCTDASDITADGFTANWEALPEACSYSITVNELIPGATFTHRNEFADGIMNPADWYVASGCTTSSFSGYYGAMAPGLSMTADNAYVQSPLDKEMISEVKFWYRGIKTEDRHSIKVYGYDGRRWCMVSEIKSLVTDKAGATVTLDEEFARIPCYSVHIAYSRPLAKGTLALDDINVTHTATTSQPVEGYDALEVGNTLSATITGLKPSTLYSYTVTANNSTMASLASTPRLVRTSTDSGLDTAFAPQPGVDITTNGNAIIARNGNPDETILRIFDFTGSCVHSAVIAAGAEVSITLGSGLYIAVADGTVSKLAVGSR